MSWERGLEKGGDERPQSPEGWLDLGLAGGGSLRWAAADIGPVLEWATRRLDLWPVPAAAFGRCLAGAALLQRMATKTPSRLLLEARGDGPILRVLAEADDQGNLRGLVGDGKISVPNWPDGKLGVGRAVGRGNLRVMREYVGGGTYHSQVALVSGEIGQDVAAYLEQSEQIRSAVLLGVFAKPEGIAAAGGIVIEVLPGAKESCLTLLEKNLAALPGVSHLLEVGGIEELVATVLAGLDREVRASTGLRYRCRCSRERLRDHLELLAPEELATLLSEGGTIDADCVFCAECHRFTPEELQSTRPTSPEEVG